MGDIVRGSRSSGYEPRGSAEKRQWEKRMHSSRPDAAARQTPSSGTTQCSLVLKLSTYCNIPPPPRIRGTVIIKYLQFEDYGPRPSSTST